MRRVRRGAHPELRERRGRCCDWSHLLRPGRVWSGRQRLPARHAAALLQLRRQHDHPRAADVLLRAQATAFSSSQPFAARRPSAATRAAQAAAITTAAEPVPRHRPVRPLSLRTVRAQRGVRALCGVCSVLRHADLGLPSVPLCVRHARRLPPAAALAAAATLAATAAAGSVRGHLLDGER